MMSVTDISDAGMVEGKPDTGVDVELPKRPGRPGKGPPRICKGADEIFEVVVKNLALDRHFLWRPVAEAKLAHELDTQVYNVKLAVERLIELAIVERGRKGIRRHDLSHDALRGQFTLRVAMEQSALRWLINTKSERDRARIADQLEIPVLSQRYRVNDGYAFLNAGIEFHCALIEKSLPDWVPTLRAVLRRIKTSSFISPMQQTDQLKGIDQHLLLLKYIREGRADEANALMEQHLRDAMERALEGHRQRMLATDAKWEDSEAQFRETLSRSVNMWDEVKQIAWGPTSTPDKTNSNVPKLPEVGLGSLADQWMSDASA